MPSVESSVGLELKTLRSTPELRLRVGCLMACVTQAPRDACSCSYKCPMTPVLYYCMTIHPDWCFTTLAACWNLRGTLKEIPELEALPKRL